MRSNTLVASNVLSLAPDFADADGTAYFDLVYEFANDGSERDMDTAGRMCAALRDAFSRPKLAGDDGDGRDEDEGGDGDGEGPGCEMATPLAPAVGGGSDGEGSCKGIKNRGSDGEYEGRGSGRVSKKGKVARGPMCVHGGHKLRGERSVDPTKTKPYVMGSP